MNLTRLLWMSAGGLAFAVGTIGIALPLLPTVPFYWLAAFCFARSNPVWEQWLLDHPVWGPPIVKWRERRAIARRAKLAAIAGLTGSSIMSLAFLTWPWSIFPALACLASGTWIWTRAE